MYLQLRYYNKMHFLFYLALSYPYPDQNVGIFFLYV